MPNVNPKQFGKYQLLNKIALGGMAELYRAKVTGDHGFEKLVAIKKILPHLSDEGNLVKAFIDEAKLAALLHHENIVQIYDFGSMQSEYFIAMEYLFGKDLRKLTFKAKERNLPLRTEDALYIVSRICAGLDYSHNLRDLQGKPLNLIHRDINPQNIFITYEGQVKIIDFGIAKAASHNSTTHEGLIKGKLAYMSPEQAKGKTIDRRSDIFSTGIILYELLTGKRMFEGETMHVYAQVRNANYEPLVNVLTDLSPQIHKVLQRALEKEPNNRYQSCGEMLADLEDCIFQLSYHPNTRSFAEYVKTLFKEEFATEETSLWPDTRINSSDRLDLDTYPHADGGTNNSTIQLAVPESSAQIYHPIWRLPLVACLILLSIVFDISLTKFPFTPSDREVSAYPIELSALDTYSYEDKIAAGKASLQAKRFALAVALFEEIISSNPSSIANISSSYLEALQGLAADLVKKDPDGAKTCLRKALELEPLNVAVLSQLGFIYLTQNNYPKAIETYHKVADLDPEFPDTYFNLGYIYAITEDYPKAKEMYSRVVGLAPAFLDEALFNLAMVQAQLDEREQCIQSLEQALEIDPHNKSVITFLRQLKKEKENVP